MGGIRTQKARDVELFSHWHTLIDKFQASSLDFYAGVEQALASREIPRLKASRVYWPEGGWLSGKREYLRLQRERLVFDICAAPFGTGFFVSWRFGERPLRIRWLIILLAIVAIWALVNWGHDLMTSFMFSFARFTGIRLWLYVGFGWTPIVMSLIVVLFALILLWLLRRIIGRGLLDADLVFMQIPLIAPLYERYFRRLSYYRIDLMIMYRDAVHSAVLHVVDQLTQARGVAPLSELQRRPILRELFNQPDLRW